MRQDILRKTHTKKRPFQLGSASQLHYKVLLPTIINHIAFEVPEEMECLYHLTTLKTKKDVIIDTQGIKRQMSNMSNFVKFKA